jgi:hypothetical protein
MQPERRDESPLYVRKPFGISTRPSSAKDFDRMRQLIDGPPELISSDDEMPVADSELVEAIMPTISGNGGASTVVKNLLENQLLRPDSHEEFVVSYGLPRPRIAVDYKKWSSLSHPEQEVLLNYVSGVDFLRDLPPTELKLVHKIEPDNSKLDYDLLSAIQRGVDEADMNMHVRLLRLLWNSRPKGHQHENEMILRAKILDNGMSQHRFPWIAPDIELADLEDPKFLPMDRETHTSHWFDREHFEHQNSDRIQPSTLDQIWISQHTQWLMLQKQDPAVFDDPEQFLQAHTEAIVKYLAARKLHQEANAADGKDLWTWLAVANSYLEQNPVDLALLPCATMPDGIARQA